MERTIKDLNKDIGEYFPALLRHAQQNKDLQIAVSQGLDALDKGSLSWAPLNQIMHLCSQAGMNEGFYRYYFLVNPETHPYPCEKVFSEEQFEPPEGTAEVQSLRQLHWGIRRFIYDAMLYWGNFRQAYRDLRGKTCAEIEDLFRSKRVDERRLITRGKVADPFDIPRDNRFLISETACKTYAQQDRVEEADHVRLALEAFDELRSRGIAVTPEKLKEETRAKADGKSQLDLFDLLYEDATESITSREDVIALYTGQWKVFKSARDTALQNTRIYLSICNDLDVYVATSMRTRDDFRDMARACQDIFKDERLKKYNLRYFDPTLSAAKYHEDKGIIECLMVKTCRVLLYFAQHKESLGKVSELAMALTLGKPVIVLYPSDARGMEIYRFYLERHPLLRLVEFATGVVNGAIVTQSKDHVVLLLERIFSNKMEYDINRKDGTEGYYLLKERLTQSTTRIVTDDQLLTETFWNNYNSIY
jgi:hypothetical protein